MNKTIEKAIQGMTVSELTELNRLVVFAIRNRQPELADAVKVGSVVEFRGRGGFPTEGVVIKKNRMKAIVQVGAGPNGMKGQMWNVPYSMLCVVSR